jgi:hypothetical protein
MPLVSALASQQPDLQQFAGKKQLAAVTNTVGQQHLRIPHTCETARPKNDQDGRQPKQIHSYVLIVGDQLGVGVAGACQPCCYTGAG